MGKRDRLEAYRTLGVRRDEPGAKGVILLSVSPTLLVYHFGGWFGNLARSSASSARPSGLLRSDAVLRSIKASPIWPAGAWARVFSKLPVIGEPAAAVAVRKRTAVPAVRGAPAGQIRTR